MPWSPGDWCLPTLGPQPALGSWSAPRSAPPAGPICDQATLGPHPGGDPGHTHRLCQAQPGPRVAWLCSQGFWQRPEPVLTIPAGWGGVLRAPGGQGCSAHPPGHRSSLQQRIIRPQMSTVPKSRKPAWSLGLGLPKWAKQRGLLDHARQTREEADHWQWLETRSSEPGCPPSCVTVTESLHLSVSAKTQTHFMGTVKEPASHGCQGVKRSNRGPWAGRFV